MSGVWRDFVTLNFSARQVLVTGWQLILIGQIKAPTDPGPAQRLDCD